MRLAKRLLEKVSKQLQLLRIKLVVKLKRPNTHQATKVRLPVENRSAYIRKHVSDYARVVEYAQSIYSEGSYLSDTVRVLKPRYLVDVGANIGLSTLSFLDEFSSLTNAVAIEANSANFEIFGKKRSVVVSRTP